jgi:hypothetical protein
VESADLGHFHDPTECGRLDRAWDRRVFGERQVRSRSVVILDVRAQQACNPDSWSTIT